MDKSILRPESTIRFISLLIVGVGCVIGCGTRLKNAAARDRVQYVFPEWKLRANHIGAILETY